METSRPDREKEGPSIGAPDHPHRGLRRSALPGLTVGLGVALLGVIEAATGHPGDRGWLVLIALCMGVIVGSCRAAPGTALVAVWVVFAAQLAFDLRIVFAELSVTVIAFGTARWGRRPTLWASGLSIPLAAAILLIYVRSTGLGVLLDVVNHAGVVPAAGASPRSTRVIVATVATAVLALPWLVGLALRSGARARAAWTLQLAAEEAAGRATRDTEQARELAHLREQQARLARDVHDVVGHSLAVILAQAESAQFLPDSDPSGLKRTMSTIATSARASLQDVRQVLTTGGTSSTFGVGGLETLVDGLRASGHDLTFTETGQPRPLTPEIEVVVYRVAQEMLTNAIKHGHLGAPLSIERCWDDGVQLVVSNSIGPRAREPGETPEGRGLDGMRRRLGAVGGRLETSSTDGGGGAIFTARAWIPVQAMAS